MWSAAILTGGQARHFWGHDQGGLAVEGRTILERQLAEQTTLTDRRRLLANVNTPVEYDSLEALQGHKP
jgi:GTP:adenosylcobinamide-phosphate guanylyltransferase